MILGIESSQNKIGVALADQGQVVLEKKFPLARKHSEQIGDLVLEMLNAATIPVSAISISGGPGSYTGLRIGSSLAKGLCFGLNIPLVAVNSLLSCAWDILNSENYTELNVLSVLPSRQSEVYLAMMRLESTFTTIPSQAIPISEIDEWLSKNGSEDFLLVGPGSELIMDTLSESNQKFTHVPNVTSEASSVAILGEMRLNRGQVEIIETYEPDYLKPFVAKQGTPIFERLEKNRKRQ